MSTKRIIASHLRLSGEALAGARLLLDGGNGNAVYLAEQAVEQIVLALAQAEELHFPRSAQHQLDTMIRGLPDENPFKGRLAPVAWLEAYATTFRYPRTAGAISDPPTADKLEGAVSSIAAVRDALVQHFGHARPPR